MSSLDKKTEQVFFELLRAGLWEKDVRLSQVGSIDFAAIMRLAEEQSVVGLVTAGLEHVKDSKVPQTWTLQLIGSTLQLEQRNIAMNQFIEGLVDDSRKKGIYTILVKGQGVAQCYERPMWRTCGDVDFLLNDDNYPKAQSFFISLANSVEIESENHQGMNIGPWVVEIHGDQHCGLSLRMDRIIDEVQRDIFYAGSVRSWENGKTIVFLPGVNEDVILVFTHFIKHFFKEGLGLRQICDWCRLLWRFRDKVDDRLLESRIRRAGLMSEWRAFAAFAVEYLGMPIEGMPMYSSENKWKRKADKICKFVMEVGNMGHNREDSSVERRSFFARKVVSFNRRVADLCNHAFIFPMDSLRFFPLIVFNGIKLALRGVG